VKETLKSILKWTALLVSLREMVKFVYFNFILPRRYSLEMTPHEIAKKGLELPMVSDAYWFPFIGHLLAAFTHRTVEFADASIIEHNKKFRELNQSQIIKKKSDYEGFRFDIAGIRFVVLVSPEDIKYVTQTNFQNYVVGKTRQDNLKDFLGVGIFTSDGEFWKEQRNLAKLSFANAKLDAMLKVFIQHGEELLAIIEEQNKKNQSIEVQSLFLSYTLDCSGEILFNHPVGSLHAQIPFQKAFDFLQVEIEKLIAIPFLRYIPSPKYNAALKVCNDFVAEIIQRAKSDQHLAERNDLLAQFMTMRDENGNLQIKDDQYLRDLLMNFLIAGRDTTATTLTWLFHELSLNPRVHDRIYAEIQTLFPDTIPTTLDEVRSLKYLKDSINETLRLHPPVPKVLRCSVNDDVLPSGYKIKASSNVLYDTYALHRNEEIWGADALVFDPDRWTDERTKSIGSFEFLPFHGGPRRCLGFDLAYNEVKLATVMILKKYKIENDINHKVLPYEAIILQSQNGVKVYFKERAKNTA